DQQAGARLRQARLEHGVRGADAGMAGEGHLALRAEHAQAVTGLGRGSREHEGRFRQPRPARDRLHGGVVQAFGVEYHGQGVAGTGAVGEDVNGHEVSRAHAGLRWGNGTGTAGGQSMRPSITGCTPPPIQTSPSVSTWTWTLPSRPSSRPWLAM